MGYYDFPHTRNYDTDLGYLIDWFNKNKNKIEENTAITIEKALTATEEAIKAYNSATSASDSAELALELKNQTEGIKNLMQDKIEQIDTNTNRINNLATIDPGSITTTADAELVDIRVGANETKYPSAGDAVRGQFSELKGDFNSLESDNYIKNIYTNTSKTDTQSNLEWGFKTSKDIYKLVVKPFTSGHDGDITAKRYICNGDVVSGANYILVESVNKPMGKSFTFKNLKKNEFVIFIHSNGSGYYTFLDISPDYFDSQLLYISDNSLTVMNDGFIYCGEFEVFENKKPLVDKKIRFIGDSRTWYDGQPYGDTCKSELVGKICKGYQRTVQKITGCDYDSSGYNGGTSQYIASRITSQDLTNIDYVILDGGVNDFVVGGMTMGTIQPIGSTFDTSTTYGAWQYIIEYILSNYPNTKIVVNTEFPCWINGVKLPKEYPNAKREVAELYGLPCFDAFKISRFNELNRDLFYCDDVATTKWYLHLNDLGNEWFGALLGSFILSNQ